MSKSKKPEKHAIAPQLLYRHVLNFLVPYPKLGEGVAKPFQDKTVWSDCSDGLSTVCFAT